MEAGIELKGTEVKSIRNHAAVRQGQAGWLFSDPPVRLSEGQPGKGEGWSVQGQKAIRQKTSRG